MQFDVDKFVELGKSLLRISFDSKTVYSSEDIDFVISKLNELGLNRVDNDYVERSIKSQVWVEMEEGSGLVNQATHKKWLGDKRAQIDFYFWRRYKSFLIEDKGWSVNVVNTLDEVSDSLIELIGDPDLAGSWARKGLLLGDVQSGKTSNYLAICNKAADVGYKIVILLTGTLENLRRQTQERVDEGFTGRNSRDFLKTNPEGKYIGVGFKEKNLRRCAVPFTSIDYDFNKNLLDSLHLGVQDLKEPVVLVVKKNKSVLDNLESWLQKWCSNGIDKTKIEYPILVIDDESDNASVNTSKDSINAINHGIRKILDLFSRSSYLGVTATPFANIFIDPFEKEGQLPDLFPKDYIYALNPPSNYIGSNDLFGEESKYSNAIKKIEDADDYFPLGHKITNRISNLPDSLKEAIVYFCLSNVIRDIRKNTSKHRSMLINVSRFVDVQNNVFEKVREFFFEYRERVTNYILLDDSQDYYVTLTKKIYERNRNISDQCVWKLIRENLVSSISSTKIMQVNKNNSYENLDYSAYNEIGLRVIAIGGNSLSRGLTLEGLCVSYFYRNSMMYDTLMQMGRWFGYRENYQDLFRLWLPNEGIEWYKHITSSTNELRDEIKYMQRQGLTPLEFGLKVQAHQESLLITARNKMRYTTKIERLVSLEGRQIETFKLRLVKENIDHNYQVCEEFIYSLGAPSNKKIPDKIKLWEKVGKIRVASFVSKLYSHPSNIYFNPVFVSNYIEELEQYPEWDVVVPISGVGQPFDFGGIQGYTSARSSFIEKDAIRIAGKHNRVGMPGDAKFGMTIEEQVEAEEVYKSINGAKKTYPSFAYLKRRTKPLLIIYLIDVITEDEKDNELQRIKSFIGTNPVPVVSASFPSKDGVTETKKLVYYMNLIDQLEYLEYEDSQESDDFEVIE